MVAIGFRVDHGNRERVCTVWWNDLPRYTAASATNCVSENKIKKRERNDANNPPFAKFL
jgi:hypothetical protein